jgi:hypothetical protein
MPTIFGDKRRIGAQGAGPVRVEHGEVKDDDMAVLRALADEVIQAVKSGSADKLANALKAIHHECQEYDEEE